jgi:hypothetical protein
MHEYYFLLLIAIIAFMYASVGHGGASGYLALMVIFGVSPVLMKPSALILNIIVSAISFGMYYRHGHFKWKILLPFILLSIPLSFLGARITIEAHTYKMILGVCLLIATLRLVGVFGKTNLKDIREVKFIPAMLIGGLLGFVSGMIGIGGGILLSPVILLLKWGDMKQTAAVSAAFIFVNSVSGIIGASSSHQSFSPEIYAWVLAAVVGGSFGAFYGSGIFKHSVLKYILSAVLIFASTKLFIG